MEPIFEIIIISFLFILSGMTSATELAFFSLSPRSRDEMKQSGSRRDKYILQALERPKSILATLLIANNLANIGIVLLSGPVAAGRLDYSGNPWISFMIHVVAVTFLILLFSEVIPKVFANQHAARVARFMIFPFIVFEKILYPLSFLLIKSTSFLDRRLMQSAPALSVEDLSHALDLTIASDLADPEKKILRGIVRFGQINVKQIMRPRMDVVAIEQSVPYPKLLERIRDSGYSRLPVYRETLDKVSGILSVKDLLPHLDREADFKWQDLIREPLFVPENKKNDDLLKEFQHRKIHMAIVVDEFGGTSGVVTLEDVMEEIVGEINDEFDDDDLIYSKLDEQTYVFEGKVSLSDFSRKLGVDTSVFSQIQGREADTLAGFLIERAGQIPKKGDEMRYKNYIFTIESSDNRKIKRVKISVLPEPV